MNKPKGLSREMLPCNWNRTCGKNVGRAEGRGHSALLSFGIHYHFIGHFTFDVQQMAAVQRSGKEGSARNFLSTT